MQKQLCSFGNELLGVRSRRCRPPTTRVGRSSLLLRNASYASFFLFRTLSLSLSLSLSVSLLFLFSIPTRPPAVMGHWVAGPLDLSANTYHVILRSMGIDGAFIALAA